MHTEQKADCSRMRVERSLRMKKILLFLLLCAAVSNALPVHPEKDNKEDAKLVEVTLLSISEIYSPFLLDVICMF